MRTGLVTPCLMAIGCLWPLWSWGGPAPASSAKPPVAIVAYVSGSVECALPGAPAAARRVDLFDVLAEGTELRTGAESVVRIAFASGCLYELAANGQSVVALDGFKSCRGSCRLVSRITATDLGSIIETKGGHKTAVAMRIRDGCTSELVSLPDPVIVRLAPWIEPGSHQQWRLTIMDKEMHEVFASDVTRSADLTLPPGKLSPGTMYLWSLRAIDDGKAVPVVEEKSLRILGVSEARLRKGLRDTFEDTKEVSWLLLLARWDAEAGLGCEACAELREALQHVPENAAIRDRLSELGCRE